jgi:alpha-tubulin suppressor-like RCC1 family protein
VPVDGIVFADVLAAGTNHACAGSSGALRCWGQNGWGELGSGMIGNGSLTPVEVVGLSGASAVGCGGEHTCAVVSGSVACWGNNAHGVLGVDPQMTSVTASPVNVSGIANAN